MYQQPYFINEGHLANDVPGHIIAAATHQPLAHIATVLPVWEHGGMVEYRFEALISKGYVCNLRNPRVRLRPVKVPLTDDEYRRMLQFHKKLVGTKYPNLAWLGLEYVYPTLRHQRRTRYCSQAAVDGMVYSGLCRKVHGRPHPGIPQIISETLALERQKHTIAP
jgi:hypothetical protein